MESIGWNKSKKIRRSVWKGDFMNKYNIIKKHIDSIDYYGLLSGGAPNDEFDNESRTIAGLISTESTVEDIASIIANVFEKSFGNTENAKDYLNIATKIRDELSGERK